MQLTKGSDRAAMVFALSWCGGLNLHERARFLSWNRQGQLVSLFDLMKAFLADAVFKAGRQIESTASFLDKLDKPHASLSDKNRKKLRQFFQSVKKGCEYLELPASALGCEDFIKLLKRKDPPVLHKDVQPLFRELNKRIEAELKAHVYLCIPSGQSLFLKNPLDEWGDTITAFPSIRYDIEEASKCLALQRNTAVVFHLMRVMGAGVKALGESLNEPTLDASHNLTWDNVLRRCAKESEKEFKDMSPVWQSDKQFFATATAKLYAVKDAWRNPNAHEIGDKYTSEETLDIYRTIRSFMRQLATKLKESP
jgi:hypothetical protein